MKSLRSLAYNIKFIFLFISVLSIQYGFSQCDNIETVQPTIMVIPWTRTDEDILNKIEYDANFRTVLSVIKDAFIQKDFNTEDFITEYENLLKDNAVSLNKSAKDDIIKNIIENTTADILVKAEIRINHGNLGNYIGVELSAEEVGTGENLANLPEPEAQSGQVRTENYSKLAYKALYDHGGLDRFLNDMNKSFSFVRKKGKTVSVKIEISNNADINFDTEMDDDYNFFSDLIMSWVKIHANKNNYHIKGNTENLMYFDVIKIPLFDEECNNYNASSFERDMRKGIYEILKKAGYLSTHKLSRGVNGNRIYFNIEKRR